MDEAPFRLKYHWRCCAGEPWALWMRSPKRFIGWFDTQGEAIDYAYENWPWWP